MADRGWMSLARPVARRLQSMLVQRRRRAFPLVPPFPAESRTSMPLIERMSDEQLVELNGLLDWNCFLLDARGRRFGNIARPGKRTQPERIPDPRIGRMDERFGLDGRTVLEFGCFEGIHTAALCRFGASVTAVDARIDHVAKTLLRCALLGHRPEVLACDLEDPRDCEMLPRVELIHHVGVLYHLADPVGHLCRLRRWCTMGLMLDTHYAPASRATETYESEGGRHAFMRYDEGGRQEAFSGMARFSRWLTLDTLCGLLEGNGFEAVEVSERRDERNGPRALIFARRSADSPLAPA